MGNISNGHTTTTTTEAEAAAAMVIIMQLDYGHHHHYNGSRNTHTHRHINWKNQKTFVIYITTKSNSIFLFYFVIGQRKKDNETKTKKKKKKKKSEIKLKFSFFCFVQNQNHQLEKSICVWSNERKWKKKFLPEWCMATNVCGTQKKKEKNKMANVSNSRMAKKIFFLNSLASNNNSTWQQFLFVQQWQQFKTFEIFFFKHTHTHPLLDNWIKW